mgnify:CR=1 FL=1
MIDRLYLGGTPNEAMALNNTCFTSKVWDFNRRVDEVDQMDEATKARSKFMVCSAPGMGLVAAPIEHLVAFSSRLLENNIACAPDADATGIAWTEGGVHPAEMANIATCLAEAGVPPRDIFYMKIGPVATLVLESIDKDPASTDVLTQNGLRPAPMQQQHGRLRAVDQSIVDGHMTHFLCDIRYKAAPCLCTQLGYYYLCPI